MPAARIQQIGSPLTPVQVMDRLTGEPGAVFLDSALSSAEFARYSFVACRPFLTLLATGRGVAIRAGVGTQCATDDPFRTLRRLLREYRISRETLPEGVPLPFLGGAVGYLGYDLCHHIERLPRTARADCLLPDMWFGFYDTILAFDHATETWWACATDFGGRAPASAPLGQRLEFLDSLLHRSALHWDAPAAPAVSQAVSNFTRDEYLRAIRRTKDYIAAGDIFQANIAQRFSTHIDAHPWQLYRRLREVNAAPFAAYIDLDGGAVASSSPERFLKVTPMPDGRRRVQTRPIKGTRPRRAGDDAFNATMRSELLASAKDNAELTMIVDLERNDLGRVCEYGSVRVTDRAALEEYATVHHLVATVEGDLHSRHDIIDLLMATFPGGSITGAPKIRAMQIIDELEPTRRSVYTGAIGYIGFDGSADLNIAIRTMLIDGRTCTFQVGGGIVADSEPEMEYEETLDKGRAMFEALGCPCPGGCIDSGHTTQ